MNLIEQKQAQIARLQERAAQLQREIKVLRKRNSTIKTVDVAQAFKVSRQTVLRMISDGRLKAYQEASRGWYRITRRSLLKLQRDIIARTKTIRFHNPSTPV
jgi:excisionase family DNA binding protein